MSATVANTAKKPMSCLTRHVVGFRDFVLRGNVVRTLSQQCTCRALLRHMDCRCLLVATCCM